MKVQISSNEDLNKDLIQKIMAFYNPEDIEVKKLDVADIIKGRCAIELKITAADFFDSLQKEPGATVPRIIRQANDLQQYERPHIVVGATLPELIFESRKWQSETHWNLDSLVGYIASIESRFGVPIKLWGSIKLEYYIYSLLEKSNDGKVTIINPLKAHASPSQEQEAIVSSIKDIGPETSKALLSYFLTVNNVFNASPEELKKVPGIGPKTAHKIHELVNRSYTKC